MTTTNIDFESKLPKWVYIGHYDFRVHVVDADHPKLEGADGMTYTGDETTIYVARGLSLFRLLYVVRHEVDHAINWFKGVEDGITEERFTELNSEGEADLFLDNPRLINWMVRISRAIRKQRSERQED